jgi:hypothetical protein
VVLLLAQLTHDTRRRRVRLRFKPHTLLSSITLTFHSFLSTSLFFFALPVVLLLAQLTHDIQTPPGPPPMTTDTRLTSGGTGTSFDATAGGGYRSGGKGKGKGKGESSTVLLTTAMRCDCSNAYTQTLT